MPKMVGVDLAKKRKRNSKDNLLASVDVATKPINESNYDQKCGVEQVQFTEGMSSTKRWKKRKGAPATDVHILEMAPALREKNKVRRKSKKLPKTSLKPTVDESKMGDASSVTAPPSCTTKVREYETTLDDDDDDAPPIPEKTHKRGKRKCTSSSKRSSGTKNSPGKCCPKPAKQKAPEGHHNQTETEAPLEGIMHDGTMYLLDESNMIFSSRRDSQGRLVQVGCVDKTGARVIFAGSTPEDDAGSTGLWSEQTPSMEFGDARLMDGSKEVDEDADSAGRKRRERKKAKKSRRQEGKRADEGGAQAARSEEGSSAKEGTTCPISPRVGTVKYPFEVEDCDHCETSEQAYEDIAPLLVALAKELGKRPCELAIYDPYYCQGSSVKRLASVGFPSVYNRNEDFYKVWREETIPEHDVLVTNPPFSGHHVPNILRFCSRAGRKPWFLLLPNFVYLKEYYEPSLSSSSDARPLVPFFLTPPKRYSFYSPQGSRVNVKSSERKTSPFNTFWYVYLGGDEALASKVLRSFNAASLKRDPTERCCLARTPALIPYKMMDSNDPRRKKARDRQRSIDRIRRLKSSWAP